MTDDTDTTDAADPDPDTIELHTDVELIELASLTPYADNPKNHPAEQVDKIAQSIQQYGMDQPIVIDGDGEIIKGHGRFQAAQRLGLETVPVIWQDGLTPPEVKAARIADNKTQLESGFDYDVLASEFADLNDTLDTPDVADLTAFETPDIDELLERDGTDIDEFMSQPDRDMSDDGDDADGASDDSPPEDVADGEYDGPDVPPGAVECPECGHAFEPTLDEMGE